MIGTLGIAAILGALLAIAAFVSGFGLWVALGLYSVIGVTLTLFIAWRRYLCSEQSGRDDVVPDSHAQ